MIIRSRKGGQIIVAEALFAGSAYLAIGNSRGSQGILVDRASLARLRAELDALERQFIAAEQIKKSKLQRRRAA